MQLIQVREPQYRIASILDLDEQLVSYHIRKAEELGLVRSFKDGTVKILELTAKGKKLLDQYDKNLDKPSMRLENISFKAKVHTMPSSLSVDWQKVEMTNWTQYRTEVDEVLVKLNVGNEITVEFLISPIDGHDPYVLYGMALCAAMDAAEDLESRTGISMGRLTLSSRAEWAVYDDPVIESATRYLGQVTVDGLAKVNKSKPGRRGEVEYHHPRRVAEYVQMPSRIRKLESSMETMQADIDDIKEMLTRSPINHSPSEDEARPPS